MYRWQSLIHQLINIEISFTEVIIVVKNFFLFSYAISGWSSMILMQALAEWSIGTVRPIFTPFGSCKSISALKVLDDLIIFFDNFLGCTKHFLGWFLFIWTHFAVQSFPLLDRQVFQVPLEQPCTRDCLFIFTNLFPERHLLLRPCFTIVTYFYIGPFFWNL